MPMKDQSLSRSARDGHREVLAPESIARLREIKESDFFVEMSDLVLAQIHRCVPAIAQALAQDDMPTARAKAHLLGGDVKILGATRLAELCGVLQDPESPPADAPENVSPIGTGIRTRSPGYREGVSVVLALGSADRQALTELLDRFKCGGESGH